MFLRLLLALPTPVHAFPSLFVDLPDASDEPGQEFGSPDFWYRLIVSICLVLAGGVFAGLTLGLMGLDELHLRVLSTSSDDPKERKNAQKGPSLSYPLPSLTQLPFQFSLSFNEVDTGSSSFFSSVMSYVFLSPNPVMSSQSLLSQIVNESLPIFLDSALGGGVAAIAISTTMIGTYHAPSLFHYFLTKLLYVPIVIFGYVTFPSIIWLKHTTLITLTQPPFSREIIPQAVSVRYGLSVGASCAPVVLGMMYLFAPVAWPIAKLLDYVLGHNETHTYKKAELRSFLAFHRQGEEPLRDDEISILNGVLELNNKQVEQIMTPMQDVVTISADRVLDHNTVDYLLRSGYSRIPVHKPGHPLAFIGILLVKTLSIYDPSSAIPVSELPLSLLPEAPPTINCFQALDYFQTGRAHLLLLSRTPGIEGGAIGVITLEDIIEEIISEEIVDETDRYEDNVSKRRASRMKNAAVMKGIVEYRVGTHALPEVGESSPLMGSRNQSPLPITRSRVADSDGALLNMSPKPAQRAGSTLNPYYGSVVIGSPRDSVAS
ncbi:transporter [Ganoderma sinense ZZ0214-1]|uniref:Transporter n=1 Tax=Ganoderma sinense ZZ0214-1 TaxID=1077348 RepID=A0A2G8SAL1_9APHY|nr:transporter [Ganoderma sinense ZZ0214-1]